MKIKVVVLLLACMLFCGCAKTVTEIVDFGQDMVVSVTLRGNFDHYNNRYFLVLSSNSGLKIPLPPPDNIDYEMIEPGSDPIMGSKEAYFTNYYTTWGSYVILDPGGYFLVNGPFVYNQTTTRETLALVEQTNVTLTYHFSLGQVFGASVPSTIYFDVVTVPWPNGQKKLSTDHLTSTNAYISKISGSKTEIEDGADYTIDADVDIIRCRAEVQ